MAEELQNKLGGLSPAARDAALQTIFGSDAMRAATVMMNSGEEGLATYIKATNDQEAAQRLANSQMGEGSLAIEEMKGSLETAAITIGQTLAPVITKVAEFITELANKFSALPQGVQTGIVAFAGIIAVLGPLLMVIGQVMTGISAIAGVLSLLSAPISTVVVAISVAVATIGLIIAAIKNWGAVTEWFGNLWQIVKDKCAAIWDAICLFLQRRYRRHGRAWWKIPVDTRVVVWNLAAGKGFLYTDLAGHYGESDSCYNCNYHTGAISKYGNNPARNLVWTCFYCIRGMGIIKKYDSWPCAIVNRFSHGGF